MFRLATIVTSKTRVAVLELFLKNPALELGVRETARRLDSNVMAVRNELVLLEEGGLLKCRKVANSVQYSLDIDCPAITPLRSLIEMNDGKEASPEPSASEGGSEEVNG